MIFVLSRGGELVHLAAAEVPSLERLTPSECGALLRELAADVRRFQTRADGERPAAGDIAIEGEW